MASPSEEMPQGNHLGVQPEQIIGRSFRFTAGADGQMLAPRLSFCVGGGLSGYQYANERSWCIEDGRLILLNLDNQRTCILTLNTEEQGHLYFSGRYLSGSANTECRLDECSTNALRRIGELPDLLSFAGEFGEEVNQFIPYIYWLHRTGDLGTRRIETYPGMEPFYYFLNPDQIRTRARARQYLPPRQTPHYYLHANGVDASQAGLEWAPDYRKHYSTKFGFDKPILIIHNKYTKEWDQAPVNYLDLDHLERLILRLKDRYQIVFFEAARSDACIRGYSTDHQTLETYSDVEVARRHPEVIIFGELLKQGSDSYNLLKLKVFSSCYHIITVQGGNAHMSALFPGSLVAIQHTRGREESHSYASGIFQYLANPRPIYLIGRNGAALQDIAGAFEDCDYAADRVHLGPKGRELYRRYNPSAWRSAQAK